MILYVYSGTFPPVDGIATHVFQLADESKNECAVAVKQKRGYNRIEEYNGIKTYVIKTGVLPYINNILFSKAVKQISHKLAADIIHFHCPLVIIPRFSKDYRPKKILTVHSTMRVDTSFIEIVSINAIINKVLGRTVSMMIEKLSLKRADRIISVSPGVKQELKQYYNTDSVIIVNEVSFIESTFIQKERLILFVGRVGYRKGISTFLNAVLHSADAIRSHGYSVEVLGDGPLMTLARDFLDSNGLNDIVQLKGVVPVEVVMAKLKEAALLIMTSTYETGPRVVLEALGTKTLVIATPVGIVPFLEGFGVEIANSIEEFVEKIDTFVSLNNTQIKVQQEKISGWNACLKSINESEIINEYYH